MNVRLPIGGKHLGSVVLGSWLCFAALEASPLRPVIDAAVARPIEFRARRWLGEGPTVEPRLKILAFDDSTLETVSSPDLSARQWASLLDALARSGVERVFIDKVFGVPFPDADGVEPLTSVLDRRSPHVTVAAMVLDAPIRAARAALQPIDPRLSLAALAPSPGTSAAIQGVEPASAHAAQRFAYGPDPLVGAHFPAIGHVGIESGQRVEPLARLTPQAGLVFLPLLGAASLQLSGDDLIADGTVVPLDRDRMLPVDLVDPRLLYQRTFQLAQMLRLAEAGKTLPGFERGDVVLILPQMFTGNSDFKDSALGSVPGGFIIASVLNSALSRDWLRPVDVGGLGLLAASLAGALAGALPTVAAFGGALLGVAAAVPLAALAAFARAGILLDWPFVWGAFCTSALTTFVLVMRERERRGRRLQEALSGLVAPMRLRQILDDPRSFSLAPAESVVSILFLDVVNFSALAESMPVAEAFATVRRVMAEITAEIHKHGGTVDRTMGDGLLGYFGYAYGPGPSPGNHADHALACATAIQRDSLARALAAKERGDPILPLRVGINTAGVYIGDIGDEWRMDVTIIGSGVNFAQRLEAACEPFRIMLSPSTWATVTRSKFDSMPATERLFQVKHQSSPYAAVEVVPYESEQDRRLALNAHNHNIGLNRKDDRFELPPSRVITVGSEFGVGTIVNVSRTGFAARMDRYLAKGFVLRLELGAPRGETLCGQQTLRVSAEVRWGIDADGGFVHGLQLKGMADDELAQWLADVARIASGVATNPAAG
jgi:class 3 adenylate cyclase